MNSISFAGILNGNAKDVQALAEAAATQGFFNLELDCRDAKVLQKNVKFLESFAKDILDSPESVKAAYHFHRTGRFRTTGFKPLGIEEGAKQGRPDGFELFMLPQKELLLPKFREELNCPPLVMSNVDTLTNCLIDYERAAQMILKRLTEGLGLGNELLNAHDPSLPSVTNMGFIKYPPQPKESGNFGHIAHTDVGSLTILSATERGLQTLDNNTKKWIWVDPNDQCLFVQLGDSLKFLSRGKILPSLHRVVPSDVAPQATKYTVAYFVRANEEAEITSDDGKVWLYKDYHCRKFDAFARPLGYRPDGEESLISLRDYERME
ncbi:putative 2OG-Fe(II) oxygenase family oxidoreductase [Venustampulla echinocandica]|uniref:Putative 2OG-Fe(II) oxygenase family oxidoreductase n=1 Tax=Venustampulla echinocandica TaxID=2656787 RepID=A0A370TD43_9HELO|nr:putative 2OG-Fe(II) oxygenase family oxidoreductase [Venustampulla echinocandica]RDL32354.1 putative 2OG-Fe(II) oxygenase family oxidoreductase [Venustampulla echinocandica]